VTVPGSADRASYRQRLQRRGDPPRGRYMPTIAPLVQPLALRTPRVIFIVRISHQTSSWTASGASAY